MSTATEKALNSKTKWMIESLDRPDVIFREVLLKGIKAFNATQDYPDDSLNVGFFVAGSGTPGVEGGALGHRSYEMLYIDLLYVPESSRGQGIGRSLLLAAENWARANSCCLVWLHTFRFQAPGFYLRCGYQSFATLGSDQDERSMEFYVKRL